MWSICEAYQNPDLEALNKRAFYYFACDYVSFILINQLINDLLLIFVKFSSYKSKKNQLEEAEVIENQLKVNLSNLNKKEKES
jgi:hypothetical protein